MVPSSRPADGSERTIDDVPTEVGRLERLWAGSFGDAYFTRNAGAGQGRRGFWSGFVTRYPCRSVLEVGCGAGPNLECISRSGSDIRLLGVDISSAALRETRALIADANVVRAPARMLPFRDRSFDLVFTVGVLIHQPDAALPHVMTEISRCSRRWCLALEYSAPERTEVLYRGERGVLIKRNFGGIYEQMFPEFRLVEEMSLGADDGFDGVTGWLLERTDADRA